MASWHPTFRTLIIRAALQAIYLLLKYCITGSIFTTCIFHRDTLHPFASYMASWHPTFRILTNRAALQALYLLLICCITGSIFTTCIFHRDTLHSFALYMASWHPTLTIRAALQALHTASIPSPAISRSCFFWRSFSKKKRPYRHHAKYTVMGWLRLVGSIKL